MLDQDSSLYLISSNIFITCLLNNVWYYEEKFQVNHFCELKGFKISSISNPLARDFWLHVQKATLTLRGVFFFFFILCCIVQSCEQDLNAFLCFYRAKQDNGCEVNEASN